MSMIARMASAGLAAVLCAGTASAGTVRVEADKENNRQIVIDAQDATVAEILAGMNEKQPFELERLGDFANVSPQTRRYTGEFRHVLERVLENESHLVVTSMGKRDVQRVVIYGSRLVQPTAVVPPATQPIPATAAAIVPLGPVQIDPVVQAALDRAKKEAELAKERGELLPHEMADPGPFRRSSVHASNGRGGGGRRGF